MEDVYRFGYLSPSIPQEAPTLYLTRLPATKPSMSFLD